MPREKTINKKQIELKNIDQTIIENKDCLQVNLCFTDINVFTPKERTIMRSCFGCNVNDNTIVLKTKNSWKGLVMFFLSLAYMKYKEELEDVLYVMARPNHQRQILITNVSRYYWWLVKDSIGKWETRSDPRIEEIPAPPGYPPRYVVGRYDPEDIKESMDNFCILYGIDKEQSIVETDYSKQVPHQYKQYPVENPYKGPGTFRPTTFEEFWGHVKEKGHDPFGEINLEGINTHLSEGSEKKLDSMAGVSSFDEIKSPDG